MNHQGHQEHFMLPLFMLVLPIAFGILYGILWKHMSSENKRYAIISEVVLMLSFCSHMIGFYNYPMSIHMIRHILILLIFPPLFWAAIPAFIVEKLLLGSAFKKFATIISQPMAAYCIGMGVMWAVNAPMLFNTGGHHMHHQNIHIGIISLPENFGLDIILQLVAGVIYSLPAFAPADSLKLMPLQRIVYLFLSCIGCTILGILISLNPANMYTMASTSSDVYAMMDMQISGLIMWVPGCLIYISKSIVILSGFFKDKKLAEYY